MNRSVLGPKSAQLTKSSATHLGERLPYKGKQNVSFRPTVMLSFQFICVLPLERRLKLGN